MTDPTAAELDEALRKLVEDELWALEFEALQEMKRVRREMEGVE